jgi:hypothetical protein
VKTLKTGKKNNTAHKVSAIVIVLLIAVVGTYYLFSSHAASPYSAVTADTGALNGSAVKQACTGATDGDCVEFNNDNTTSGTGLSLGSTYEGAFDVMDSSQRAAVVAQMKAAHVTWLRLDVWPNYYNYVDDFSGDGFKIIAILEDFPPATTADMSSFATQAVDTLEPLGVQTYEVLNEVNLYSPTITAAEYVPYLKAAYTSIKAVDPGSTVLESGLGTEDDPGAADYPVDYLQAMYAAGAKGYFDAVNIHPYSYPQLPDEDSPYNMFYNLPDVYAVMVANGDGAKKVWLTEFGCPTGDDDGQTAACTDATLAESITEAYDQVKQWSWAGPLLVYDWQDSAGAGDYGLYLVDGSPKPDVLDAFIAAGE